MTCRQDPDLFLVLHDGRLGLRLSQRHSIFQFPQLVLELIDLLRGRQLIVLAPCYGSGKTATQGGICLELLANLRRQ